MPFVKNTKKKITIDIKIRKCENHFIKNIIETCIYFKIIEAENIFSMTVEDVMQFLHCYFL